jgi:hypothetical protein
MFVVATLLVCFGAYNVPAGLLGFAGRIRNFGAELSCAGALWLELEWAQAET